VLKRVRIEPLVANPSDPTNKLSSWISILKDAIPIVKKTFRKNFYSA